MECRRTQIFIFVCLFVVVVDSEGCFVLFLFRLFVVVVVDV